jgi:hypothetical protein
MSGAQLQSLQNRRSVNAYGLCFDDMVDLCPVNLMSTTKPRRIMVSRAHYENLAYITVSPTELPAFGSIPFD